MGIKPPKDISKFKESNIISGDYAFWMQATIGLPLEIQEMICEDEGWTIDVERFNELMEEHKDRSRKK